MFQIVSNNMKEVWEFFQKTVPCLDLKHNYVFTVKRYHPKRSLAANRLYWVVLSAIADEIGEDKESVHEAYKRKFLPWDRIEMKGGLEYYSPGHTPDQNTKEFSEYLDKIYNHALEFLGMWLPRPDDKEFTALVEKYERTSLV